MKTPFLALGLLGLSLLPIALLPRSAHAQDAIQYDTRMEKRADLRLKYVQAECNAVKKARRAAQQTAEPDSNLPIHKSHLDRAHLVDFMARAAKRADLRIRVSQVGIERACEEWMQREHGH